MTRPRKNAGQTAPFSTMLTFTAGIAIVETAEKADDDWTKTSQ